MPQPPLGRVVSVTYRPKRFRAQQQNASLEFQGRFQKIATVLGVYPDCRENAF
jgi:hypothetical protein